MPSESCYQVMVHILGKLKAGSHKNAKLPIKTFGPQEFGVNLTWPRFLSHLADLLSVPATSLQVLQQLLFRKTEELS